MARREERTTYFLGAGATAADGFPAMRLLNHTVAHALRCRPRQTAELARYYASLFAITPRDIEAAAKAWKAYLRDRKSVTVSCPLPDLIETLSLLDVAIQERWSLGPTRRRARGAMTRPELDMEALQAARRELSWAIASGILDAQHRKHFSQVKKLVARAVSEDATIISTNWDTAVERAVRAREPRKWLTTSGLRFGAINEIPVNWRGNRIKPAAPGAPLLLKLHGSLGWFHCPRCANLYVNVELAKIYIPNHATDRWGECDCGAQLATVMIAPSYLKDYRLPHITSVWTNSLSELAESGHWVFIGYSLPADDFHIRALLLRALSARRSRKKPLAVTVVSRSNKDDPRLETRYRDLFRAHKPRFEMGGLEEYVNGTSAD